VHGHGTRKRHAIVDTVEKWFLVDRFLCTACKKTFTLLPDFILPFKHYAAAEIERVLGYLFGGGVLSESPSLAGESTLYRWRREFRGKMQQWAGLLEAQVFKLFNLTPILIEMSSLPLTRLQKALSQLPTLPSRWTVIVKTLWWLNPSHPL
jgi:hypothetical protein